MITSKLTADQRLRIAETIARMTLPRGIGNEHNACALAAINLGLTGTLTDHVPPCMSEVIGNWMLKMQDLMPHSLRNSDEWRNLIPLAAGTGREHEAALLAILFDHLSEHTSLICLTAVAYAAAGEYDADAAADDAARAAAYAAAVAAAARAAAHASGAYGAAAAYAAAGAYGADAAARSSGAYGADAAAEAWAAINPCALLARMIWVGLGYLGTLGDPDAAKSVQESMQKTSTYEPRTQAGKDLCAAIDKALGVQS